MLVLLVASAICAHAQTLDGVTPARTGGGSPTGSGSGLVPMLDMPSPYVGGLN